MRAVWKARVSAAPWIWLTLLGCLLHAREFAGGRPYWRDTYLFFVPAKHYLAELLRAGELPAWWPWDGGGAPLLARPLFSVFHPTTLFYLLFPFWTAFSLQDLAGTLGALLGGYVVGRRYGLGRASATLVGTWYGLGGYAISMTELTHTKLAAATLPWYWASLHWAAEGPRWRWAVPSLTMGLLLLAGDPEVALLAAGSGLVLVCARRPGLKAALLGGVSPMLGGVVAAIQWIPSALAAVDTERAHPMPEADNYQFGLNELIDLVYPIEMRASAFLGTTLVGVAAVALILAAFAERKRRVDAATLAAVLLLSLGLAVGPALGLNTLLRVVFPPWRYLRYPIKASVLAFAVLPLLAGLGAESLRTGRGRWAAVVAVGALGVLGLALPVLRTGDMATWWVASAVTVGLLAAERTRWRVGGVALAGLLALGAMAPQLKLTSDAFYEPSPTVQALQADGVSLSGGSFSREVMVPDDPFQEPTRMAAAGGGGGGSYGSLFGLPQMGIYTAGSSWRVWQLFQHSWSPSQSAMLAGLFDVTSVVMDSDRVRAGAEVVARDASTGYSVVRVKRALPRAYAVHRGRPVTNTEAALEVLGGPTFKPGREVTIEGVEPSPEWANRPDQEAVPVAMLPDRRNDRVVLRADLPWPGFVVLNEAAFVGWTVSVDGAPRPLLVANGVVRAVEVPTGQHEVVFQYQVPGLTAGAGLTLLALLALTAWALSGGASNQLDVDKAPQVGPA